MGLLSARTLARHQHQFVGAVTGRRPVPLCVAIAVHVGPMRRAIELSSMIHETA